MVQKNGVTGWCHAEDQPTRIDAIGMTNNVVVVADQAAYEDNAEESDSDDGCARVRVRVGLGSTRQRRRTTLRRATRTTAALGLGLGLGLALALALALAWGCMGGDGLPLRACT